MKTYEQTCTRMGETLNNIIAWYNGEKEVGIKNSLFICENGRVEQYIEDEEGIRFNNFVQNLSANEFDFYCDMFFEAIKNKDLQIMHEVLAIFDEMDNYNLGTSEMKRRLLRIRKETQEKSYELGEKEGVKDFILFKGRVYKPE